MTRPLDSPGAQGARAALVDALVGRGVVRDARVERALRAVPRHLFCPTYPLEVAYADAPQPIGWGQTVSQPTVVGWMTELLDLQGTERVLEIGTGSGYQAAVLSRLAREVFSIERVAELAELAQERLAALGCDNVRVRVGDGYEGWPSEAPFDRVILTSAPLVVPVVLTDQLADGGRLVAPVGAEGENQKLVVIRREGRRLCSEAVGDVRFVPMVRGERDDRER